MSTTNTEFTDWYEKNSTHGEDFTWGEEVWEAARKELLKEQRRARLRARTKKGGRR